MKADGTGLTNLTNTPEAEFNPTWSSDSRLIAYQAHRDGGSEVYVMEADGSGPTNLTNSPGNDDNPEWSPNGKAIAFDSFRAGHLEICFMGADGTGLRCHNPNPDTVRRRSGDAKFWSPDSRFLAFESGSGIHVMDSESMNSILLDSPGDGNVDPSWSPDGRSLAFRSGNTNGWKTYIVKADGTGLTEIPSVIARGRQRARLAWSPDGRSFTFASRPLREICAGEADGTSLRCLPVAVTLGRYTVSPDGRSFAFSCFFEGNVSDICVMQPGGAGTTRLTTESGSSPVWSPDGRRIAFQTDRDGNPEIYVMQADGTEQRRITGLDYSSFR